MYIPALKKNGEKEVVLWDTATDTNYVRQSHAEKQCFPWRMETAIVLTVGANEEKKMFRVYYCTIRDLTGKVKHFHAKGLERIIGKIFCPLSGKQLKELFPDTFDAASIGVQRPVDFMIGLDQSEWQPERCHKATQGGDLWI